MKVFAISDLHLSSAVDKPMDIFGDGWQNHFEKISEDWRNNVDEEDVVLLGGDMSWGISIEQAAPDYALISALPGKKYVLRGNHDYYWSSLNKMTGAFPDFSFIQNNAFRIRDVVICGTRGWSIPDGTSSEEDVKIYNRELGRLTLSLDSAAKLRQNGDTLIAVMHYPPFDAKYSDSAFTELLEKYGVDKVTYGHLHGKNARVTPKVTKGGIDYLLTSCDLVDNKMIRLL